MLVDRGVIQIRPLYQSSPERRVHRIQEWQWSSRRRMVRKKIIMSRLGHPSLPNQMELKARVIMIVMVMSK